jgi:photosystem II stability/assembly factor-like uncharacterized protein
MTVGAKGQIIWKVTQSGDWVSPTKHLDSNVCFTAVSCSGNDCTAAGIVIRNPNSSPDKRIVLYRSYDAGKTWKEQSCNIVFVSQLTNNGITKLKQIDSLNVVGIGDLGYVIRTTDGGISWRKQTPPVYRNLIDIDFSDSQTGIVLGGGLDSLIFTTTDGGVTWTNHTIPGNNFYSCRSFGHGKFRFFEYGHGPIFTTVDNFATLDTSSLIFDQSTDPKYRHLLMRCTYTDGDTILAYGKFWSSVSDTVGLYDGFGMIMRTINGGKSWEKPFIWPTEVISQVDKTTPLERDTIFAAGQSNSYYLISTDRGASWQADTVLVDTSYQPYECFGLSITGDGHPVASWSYTPVQYSSLLTRGEFGKSHVEVLEKIIYYTRVYPNPASNSIKISSIDRNDPYWVIDIFGRELLSGKLSDQGTTSVDISSLPQGLYQLIFKHYGTSFAVGNIIVMK